MTDTKQTATHTPTPAAVTIKYVTRRGREVTTRMGRSDAMYRLSCLDEAERTAREVAPTDSGDVRDARLREAAAIRAALLLARVTP
jgi:hypothetical protein